MREQQWKQPLDTPHLLFILFLLHRPPQLGLLLHPKRSQSVRLFIFGLSPKSLRFPLPTAARAEDPPAGEEEKHGRAQRRRGGARRGRCQRGLPQPVIDLTHHFLAARQEHFGSRVVFISEAQQAKRPFSELSVKTKVMFFHPIMHFTSAPDGRSAFARLLLLTSNVINASNVLKSLELSVLCTSSCVFVSI